MNETVKEQIKRKKKEKAEAELSKSSEAKGPVEAKEKAPSPTLETATQTENAPQEAWDIEVLEIHPSTKKPSKKFVIQGNVKIKMHPLGLKIRNIPYAIAATHGVRIQLPFRYYKFPEELKKPDVYVETLEFDDKALWDRARKIIKAAVLERHKEDLENLPEKQSVTEHPVAS